ncbi:hypothetical protein [Vibrio owensii]|uniref:hypothetical protein n=1 Tax=Vibrio owensii TaxID=696485 RepID=UPI0018F1F14E|nr:hypothetical protein [Vibrio owensii]
MNPSYLKAVKALIERLDGDKEAFGEFSAKLLKVIVDAKADLGEQITPYTIKDDLMNISDLRERYLDSRWNCPVGHNETLSQLERISRRYDQEYINKLAASLWQSLSKLEKDA